MLALCLMLSGTYYAKNYAGIIGRGLVICNDINTTDTIRIIIDVYMYIK